MQALRTATSLKRGSCETCQILKNTLFYWTSPVAASDSFRFPVCNFIKKDVLAKMFFFEFCKISKNIFWQNTSRCLLLKFIGEFWEVFQKISFIEHLWETAYFKYKLQYLNQQILWKTISQVLLKYFIQEREVFIPSRSLLKIVENYLWEPASLRKNSFAYPPSCILHSFSKNASWLLLTQGRRKLFYGRGKGTK